MTNANDVIPDHIRIGRDGYLFLTVGTNDVVRQYDKDVFGFELLCHWRHLISSRQRELSKRGITYRHMFVPEKLTIYDNLFGSDTIDFSLSPGSMIYHRDPYYEKHPTRILNVLNYYRRRQRWRRTVIDLVGPMRRVRDQSALFFRTDSHWSFAGCQVGYFEICRSLGVEPHRDFAQREVQSFSARSGDLGMACSPPRLEPMTFIHTTQDAVRFYANPLVELYERLGITDRLHTGAHVAFKNARPRDPRKLLLFGDSYSHFVSYMLTSMLAETFAEMHFVWSTSFDWALIDRICPDIVLAEMAERFAVRVPDDRFDLDAYAEARCNKEIAAAESSKQGDAAASSPAAS